MRRAIFDDFVRGTVIPLAVPNREVSARWDIVRSNGAAQSLVSQHIQALVALGRTRSAAVRADLAA